MMENMNQSLKYIMNGGNKSNILIIKIKDTEIQYPL